MVCNKNKYQYVLLVFLLYFVLVFDRVIQTHLCFIFCFDLDVIDVWTPRVNMSRYGSEDHEPRTMCLGSSHYRTEDHVTTFVLLGCPCLDRPDDDSKPPSVIRPDGDL